MSTERLSFGFNSLIPETYKNKAEAFAKCLQHKLLTLGRVEPSSGTRSGDSRRLSNENEQEIFFGAQGVNIKSGNEGRTCGSPVETNHKPIKTEDSDEEFCSHSESENGDWIEKKEVGRPKQKLMSMSSEDSTVSWSSCQENLTDFEKFDSENEESSSLASQIKGSPKIRSFNIRTKRKELREKTWKKNSRKNHSSSTDSIDSEGIKQTQNRQTENSDPEFNSEYILLDGLEEDDIPHRILRESSSTSNLEMHFSGREDLGFREDQTVSERSDETERCNFHMNRLKFERKASEESSLGMDAQLLTPPPSPDLERKIQGAVKRKDVDLSERIRFANVETDSENVEFVEVERMTDFNVDGLSRSVRNMNGVIVELESGNPRTDFEVSLACPEDFVITCAEVVGDAPNEQTVAERRDETEKCNLKDIEKVEDDDILKSRSNMRRCSSLKSWKTPPGTPGGKKIVRFADALGLDLADVRTFLDEIPKIPSSAYEDLHFEIPKGGDPLPPSKPALVPIFQQPGTRPNFLEILHNQKICLESALVSDEGVLSVTGFIRVMNLTFHKYVHVRYTLNGWETFSDLQASYVPNSCDGFSDRFSFVLYGHTLKIGEKLEFALRMDTGGTQYWDNNGGVNYVLDCLPQTSSGTLFSSFYTTQIDPWFDFY